MSLHVVADGQVKTGTALHTHAHHTQSVSLWQPLVVNLSSHTPLLPASPPLLASLLQCPEMLYT
jgi:hypothetical protein